MNKAELRRYNILTLETALLPINSLKTLNATHQSKVNIAVNKLQSVIDSLNMAIERTEGAVNVDEEVLGLVEQYREEPEVTEVIPAGAPKKLQYKVVQCHDLHKMNKWVNDAISDGWTLVGGISVSQVISQMYTNYCQAMTREVEDE